MADACECGNEPSGSVKCGEFLTSCKPVSFSRRTLHHGVSITGTLHEYLHTFMIVTRLILLRMRNVSDKPCRDNQNTHFVFNKLTVPKI